MRNTNPDVIQKGTDVPMLLITSPNARGLITRARLSKDVASPMVVPWPSMVFLDKYELTDGRTRELPRIVTKKNR